MSAEDFWGIISWIFVTIIGNDSSDRFKFYLKYQIFIISREFVIQQQVLFKEK